MHTQKSFTSLPRQEKIKERKSSGQACAAQVAKKNPFPVYGIYGRISNTPTTLHSTPLLEGRGRSERPLRQSARRTAAQKKRRISPAMPCGVFGLGLRCKSSKTTSFFVPRFEVRCAHQPPRRQPNLSLFSISLSIGLHSTCQRTLRAQVVAREKT